MLFLIILARINRTATKINRRLDRFEDILESRTSEQQIPFHLREPAQEWVDRVETPYTPPEPIERRTPIFEEPVLETVHQPEEFTTEAPVFETQDSWWERFKIRNPDMEKFVGENLISKIGIAILVLGIAFFVKFAIDKNWINETARVGIGILSGALVNFVAHRLRSKFKSFSSVLVAGAIAIYYFTIAIAFQEYRLFGQGVAFGLMIVITAFSLLVSISYDRQELALLSLIGGFATPLMVSTGTGNYVVLFSYLLILDIGMLILASMRKWNAVNLCTFAFTLLFYTVWFYTKVYHPAIDIHTGTGPFFEISVPYKGALVFATLFYIVFTAMILINDVRKKRSSGNIELALFIGNTAFYYAIGMYLMHTYLPFYKGLFTASMAVFNMAIGWTLYKHFNADKKLIYLLVGLALTFVTLAAPVQLDGNHITLFWAAESVLLLWLSLKSELRNFLYSSVIVSVLMICSLLIDWFQYYTGLVKADLPIVFNQLFLTGLFACICLFAKNRLLKKQPEALKWLSITIDPVQYRAFLRGVTMILLYVVCQIELNYQLGKIISSGISVNIILGAFHMLYCTVLLVYFYHHKSKKLLSAAYVLSIINMIAYVVLLSTMQMIEVDNVTISRLPLLAGFRMHYLSLVCVIIHLVYLNRMLTLQSEELSANKRFMSWLFAGSIVYICSVELMLVFCVSQMDEVLLITDTHMMEEAYSHLKIQMIKIGYPILWSVLSVLFLIYGIRKQDKSMRLCSLVLQAITILKLFIYDINNVSEAGKIIAFVILGIILLIMSFMYQKIKAIIFSDEVPEA